MSRIVVVNKEALEQVARELGLAASVVERTAYRAVNAVAAKNMTRARREIVSSVNLSASYVRERMALRKAGPSQTTATIYARRRATRLATYGAKQVTRKDQGAKRGAGHYGGKRWGIHAGSGDARRNIAAGSVPAGITVAVKRGAGRKKLPGAFFMPLRAGKADGLNGMGVFIREGSFAHAQAIVTEGIRVGKHRWRSGNEPGSPRSKVFGSQGVMRHLYGPSVDQLFNRVIDIIAPDVETELEAALLRQARFDFAKALGKTP